MMVLKRGLEKNSWDNRGVKAIGKDKMLSGEPGNIFAAIPENLEKEVFEQILDSKCVTIERIISKGHSSPESGWYEQEQDEWVIVLQGEAILRFEDGQEIKLKAGNHLHIPARKKHKVAWTTSQVETIWLAVHYSQGENISQGR